jgi:hypothetical protein
MHYPPTSDEIRRFNALARIQHDVRTGAEKKCQKLKMGKDQWSPKLQILRDTIFLWKLVIKKKKRQKVSSRLLRRTSKKAGIYNPVSSSLEQAIAAETSAIKAMRSAKIHASKWRKEHNTSLANARAKKKGISPQEEKNSMN